jgi:hypothetical protein
MSVRRRRLGAGHLGAGHLGAGHLGAGVHLGAGYIKEKISAATRLIFLFKTRSRKKFFLETRSRQD